jgi:hypothetical protein
LQRDQQEFATMKEQWVSDQNKLSTGMQEEQAVLAQRKADLVRMMVDLKKMQENLRQQAKLGGRAAREEVERLRRENAVLRAHFETNANGTETQAILDENEQLRMRVQQLEASAGQASGNEVGHPQVDLPAEVELLREELQRKDSMLAELSKPEGGGGDSLRAENVLLKQLLEEKNRFVEESLLKSQQAPKTASDLERYEAELNDFRRQLETDRTELNAEVEMLRDRNKELDEAFREMEMEMSKERAELARERMRLERVREEVKADTERLQRELAVRDSMAPVQKLRDELAQKQAPGGKAEKPINDRLRGMRNQQTDGPSGS